MAQRVTAAEAVQQIRTGDVIMVGGFRLSGAPLTLIEALTGLDRGGFTIISNNLGEPGRGLGRLLLNGQISRAIGSFFSSNPDVARLHQEGRLAVQLLPQGTLAEAIRAGGAGIPAFYTPTGAETELARNKEVRRFGNTLCLLEHALTADVALIRAHEADELGNLVYRKAARNFNPLMATAAKLVIAEVDRVVPAGALAPEAIVTPHLYVDFLVVTGGRGSGG